MYLELKNVELSNSLYVKGVNKKDIMTFLIKIVFANKVMHSLNFTNRQHTSIVY